MTCIRLRHCTGIHTGSSTGGTSRSGGVQPPALTMWGCAFTGTPSWPDHTLNLTLCALDGKVPQALVLDARHLVELPTAIISKAMVSS